MMFSKKWWGKTLDRMVRSGSYTLITLIGTDTVGWIKLDWLDIAHSAGIMMLLSFLGAIVTTNMGPDNQDPSTV